MEIKLSNCNEVTLVSIDLYNELNKTKWFKDQFGYVSGRVSGKLYRMHRYIIKVLLKNDIDSKTYVDHINNKKLDNRSENLRIANAKINNRNKSKMGNATSKYYGVCKDKRKKFWITQVTLDDNKQLRAYYDKEEHAAYQYDLWVKEYKLQGSNINNIEKPHDFIIYEKKKKHLGLPNYIYFIKDTNRFRVKYKETHIGHFININDAMFALEKYKCGIKELVKIKSSIEISKEGVYLLLFDKAGEQVGKTIIDEEDSEKICKYRWWLTNKYVHGSVNNKKIRLSRFIMNYFGYDIVDHINGDKLDNRKVNLRITTRQQNNMNKSSRKNSTSKYIGVSFYNKTKRWIAEIRVNDKRVYIGSFLNEEDAAKARDIATLEHFGEYGRLNFQI